LCIAKKQGFSNYQIHKGEIGQALLACDLVCSQVSTIAYEAVLLNKPHILITTGLNFRRAPLFHAPCIIKADNTLKFTEALDRLSDNQKLPDNFKKERNDFLLNYLNNADGKALERMCHFLKKVIP